MCNVAGIFVHRHIPIMWNACIPMDLVTLFIAVSLYEVYIWGYLSYLHMTGGCGSM